MNTRLTATHCKIIAAAVVVAAVSLAICLKYFRSTFPEASLQLRVDRDQSEQIARKFLAERGIRVDGYRHAAVFTYDDHEKLFLERTLGLDKMNQLTAGPVHLWRWSHRWFRPQQKEEFTVEVTPLGQVVDFQHVRAETDPGANPGEDVARATAESFLSQTMHRDLNELEFLDSEAKMRPARTDYTFTWKQKSVNLGEGSLRVAVGISGGMVGSYTEYVKVPEQFDRDYEKLRSRNDSAQIVDQVFFVLLSGAMLIMIIVRLRKRDVPARTAGAFGLTAAALYFLSQINNFSLALSGYSTTESYGAFVGSYFGGCALEAAGVGVFIFLLVAAADPEYRDGFPHLIPLRQYFTWNGLRSRSFFMANVVGLTLAFFFFGYQTLFYYCANRMGAWAPSDIPFTNQLNTSIPWVMVLFMGFLPAVSEEMQFRAFAIPFLRRYVRSTTVAVVLAAFNWGFLHSAYPNQPFFIRGLEVGVGGVIIGFVMLRFGIMATLIWHYSVDALYTAFLLLRSPNRYFFVSGAISAGIMLVPLAVALVLYLKTGAFADEETLTGREAVPSLPPPATAGEELATTVSYQPLSKRRLALAGGLIAASLAILLVPVFRFGESEKVHMTAAEAVRAASAYLRQQGIDPARYRHVEQLIPSAGFDELQYLAEQVGVKRADEIFRESTQMIGWEVRFFRPLEVQEHRVIFDATTGRFADYRPVLDENAPGANLSEAQARARAVESLKERGYDPADFELQDAQSEKRKERGDFTFVWQAKKGDSRNVGEEKYRVEVNVAGDQITGVADEFKVPEEWRRQQHKEGLANTVLRLAVVLLVILLAGRAVMLLVAQVRSGRVPWRAALPVALTIAVFSLLAGLNNLANFESAYSTSIPLTTFWMQVGVGLALAPLFAGFGGWLLAALAMSVWPDAQALWERRGSRVWRRDAAVAAALYLAVSSAMAHLDLKLVSRWPAYFNPRMPFPAVALNSYSPAVGVFCSAIAMALTLAAALAIVVEIARDGWRRRTWWFWAIMVLFVVAIGPAEAHSLREFLVVWTVRAASYAVVLGIVAAWFRNNPLAYLTALFVTSIVRAAADLLSQGAALYRWNGALLLGLGLAAAAWFFTSRASESSRVMAVSEGA